VAQTVQQIMTRNPVCLDAKTPVMQAATTMRDQDIGDVVVMDGDQMCGVVTDRDIVVRAIAEGRDPNATKLGEVCTRDVVTLSPDAPAQEAAKVMRERAIRRLPITDNGRPVGIVSIGDLAVELDSDSALAEVSAAPPNN
jgi:CBS domain-containing protein